MKLSLVPLADTAATVLAVPAPAAAPAGPLSLAPSTPSEFLITTNAAGTEATAVPKGKDEDEKRDLDVDHALSKRWWGQDGWITCAGQWWEYGEKRVAIRWTGITDHPTWMLGLAGSRNLQVNNPQGWWRNDMQQWEINWSFPASETSAHIQTWRDLYGITCPW
jgi:hypothetical protein